MSEFKLYEISSFIQEIADAYYRNLEENDGIIDDGLEKLLQDAQGEASDKALDIARLIKTTLAKADAYEAEKKKIYQREKTERNLAERLENYLSMYLEKGKKYADANTSISWRKSTTVEVTDISTLPTEFVKIETSPMKSEIKKFLQTGAPLLGAHLEEHFNLSVK